jgi:hypothetical protein
MFEKQFYYLDDAATFINGQTGHSISPDDLVGQALEGNLYLHISASNWMVKYPYKQAFLFNGYSGIEYSCLKSAIQTFKKDEEFFLKNITVTSDELAKCCIFDNSGYIHLLPETPISCPMAITDLVVKREYLLEFLQRYCQPESTDIVEQDCIIENIPSEEQSIAYQFRRNKTGTWDFKFNHQAYPSMPESKGFLLIQHLLQNPNKPISVQELNSIANESTLSTPIDEGTLLENDIFIKGSFDGDLCIDREAVQQYKQKILELDDLIEDADARNDIEAKEIFKEQREQISNEFMKNTDWRGKTKREGSGSRKISQSVAKNIKNAIGKISVQCPELGKYLEDYIRTGLSCKYEPIQILAWIYY